jgi:hypothetical protein
VCVIACRYNVLYLDYDCASSALLLPAQDWFFLVEQKGKEIVEKL